MLLGIKKFFIPITQPNSACAFMINGIIHFFDMGLPRGIIFIYSSRTGKTLEGSNTGEPDSE
jgi:hypothetical protein